MTRARDIANFGDGIATADIGDGQVTAGKLNSTLDLSGKTVTLPAGVGGEVLQVVNNNMTGRTIISSTSFVSTQVTASITPSSTSSKVIVLMQTAYSTEATTRSLVYTLYRDSTNLGDTNEGFGQAYNTGGLQRSGLNINFLDSPNTTSSVTYTLYGRSSTGANVEIPPSINAQQQVILMEIEG